MLKRAKTGAGKPSSAKADADGDFAEWLAGRVRAALGSADNVRETKMFGGIGFMLNGNLLAGASKRGLLVRTGKDRRQEAMAWPDSRSMVMRGRVMEGYVYIDPPGATAEAVHACVRIARSFVKTLPKK